MIYSFKQYTPQIADNTFIAPSADIIGQVILGPGASVWYQAVLRGDDNLIYIDRGSNIQDGTIIHADRKNTVHIGQNVTIGHRAIIHACTIGDGSLIGMGATILSGCQIGQQCLIAAGAVVPEYSIIPNRSVVMGVPGKVVKTLSDALAGRLHEGATHYQVLVDFYKEHCYPV
jgi:carbonic anhydrase/acetyltransferase-like protein (isoleucine patch superfamily)